MKKQAMPQVNLSALAEISAEAQALAARFVKADGSIRASKPPLPKRTQLLRFDAYDRPVYDYADGEDTQQALAAYVWRQVVFAVSPKRQHQCMPTCDVFDLPDGYSAWQMTPEVKALHDIADEIVNCVPIEQWYGVKRWGQALGRIGTPQVREGGTIVYR